MGTGGDDLSNDRNDAPHLLSLRYGLGSGPGRFSADVYYFRAGIEHGKGAGGGLFGIGEVSAVGEGVRGDVEDTYDGGAGAEVPVPRPAIFSSLLPSEHRFFSVSCAGSRRCGGR